jgi:hypothetical protein
MTENSHIIVDGCDRARKAIEPRVRLEVEAEFEERLRAATFWQRSRVKQQIQAEIERRVARQAPQHGLY